MKIGGGKPPDKPDAIQFQRVNKNKETERAGDVGRETIADKVNVSLKAREITEIMGSVKSIPDFRADKVAEIKSLVDSGKYVADPDKIAGKMIDEVI